MKRKKAFSNLDPILRKKIFQTLVIGRKRDRGEIIEGKNWLSQERSLMDYCQRLDINLSFVTSFLEKTLEEKNQIKVLDIGVGRGRALLELSKIFGPPLQVCGISLTRTFVPKIPNYRHRVGPIESLILEKKYYDLIFSVRGGFSYTLNSFQAIEETLNALAPGGMALLQDGHLLLTQDWFREWITRKGFEVSITRFKYGKPDSYKYVRHTETSVDLSIFNQSYISYLNKHTATLEKIGLDRVAERKILNDFFQGAYSFTTYQPILK